MSTLSISTYSESSRGISLLTETDEEVSIVDVNATSIVATQSPDDTDALFATLDATGDAFGENTLTSATITGQAADNGPVATINADAQALAAAEDPAGDGAFAVAGTDGFVSDGAEVLVITTVDTASTQIGEDSSVSVATSETSLTAVDIDPSEWGDEDSAGTDGLDSDDTPVIDPGFLDEPIIIPGEPDPFLLPTDVDLTGQIDLDDPDGFAIGDIPAIEPGFLDEPGVNAGGVEPDLSSTDTDVTDQIDIDGNIALVEAEVTVVAEDSFVEVDASALAIEDELSISLATADIALSV